MSGKQSQKGDSANPAVQQRQRGHHLGNYFDLPAILGSFMMLLLGWVEFTGAVGRPGYGGIAVLFWIVWGVYVLEYVVKVAISHNKLAYVRGHVLELITAIFPFIGFLRALKGISSPPLDRRHLAALKALQIDKLALITVQVIFIAAVIELLLEQHANGSNINNWVDALYWSATTVTTVASQYAPVTSGGEIVSFLLMLYAVLVFTYFMSSLASTIIGAGQPAGSQGQQGSGAAQPQAGNAATSQQATPQSKTGSGTATDSNSAALEGVAAADGATTGAAVGNGRTLHLTDQEIAVLRTILQQVDQGSRRCALP